MSAPKSRCVSTKRLVTLFCLLCGSVFGAPLWAREIPVTSGVSPDSVINAGITLPETLKAGFANFLSSPFHFRISVTSKFLPTRITAWGAVDPINKESEATAQTEFFAGVSATASSETIGNQAWYRTSPPGGGYHSGTLPIQIPRAIPWQRVQPYLRNVTEIPGETISGKPTLAFHFEVSAKGLADFHGIGATMPLGTLQAASGTIFLRPNQPYRPKLAVLQETLE